MYCLQTYHYTTKKAKNDDVEEYKDDDPHDSHHVSMTMGINLMIMRNIEMQTMKITMMMVWQWRKSKSIKIMLMLMISVNDNGVNYDDNEENRDTNDGDEDFMLSLSCSKFGQLGKLFHRWMIFCFSFHRQ